jgi:hypothetical protein
LKFKLSLVIAEIVIVHVFEGVKKLASTVPALLLPLFGGRGSG